MRGDIVGTNLPIGRATAPFAVNRHCAGIEEAQWSVRIRVNPCIASHANNGDDDGEQSQPNNGTLGEEKDRLFGCPSDKLEPQRYHVLRASTADYGARGTLCV